MTALANKVSEKTKFSGSIVLGKDIFELLTSAMYVDPLSIYREYIQNAADSIDQAQDAGLYGRANRPVIEVLLDQGTRNATIRDNGAGIATSSFIKTLTAIGGSGKRGTTARGFRGVGRLAGLGYCQEMILRTKAYGETHVNTMHWDCRRLREILRAEGELDANDVVREVVTTEKTKASTPSEHFFEVELCNLVRLKNDVLLNEATLEEYLSQVAPVSFNPEFSFGREIHAFLERHGASQSYDIRVNGKTTFRPHIDRFEARRGVVSACCGIETVEIGGLSSGIDAVAWIVHTDYAGAIPDRVRLGGLRLRAGNIQIGDKRLLDSVFHEPRFNGWCIGECHLISTKLVPNARRDDLEQNLHYANLLNQLSPIAKKVSRLCRERSSQRARERMQVAQDPSANQQVPWSKAKEFLYKHSKKSISSGHRTKLRSLSSSEKATYGDVISVFSGK